MWQGKVFGFRMTASFRSQTKLCITSVSAVVSEINLQMLLLFIGLSPLSSDTFIVTEAGEKVKSFLTISNESMDFFY